MSANSALRPITRCCFSPDPYYPKWPNLEVCLLPISAYMETQIYIMGLRFAICDLRFVFCVQRSMFHVIFLLFSPQLLLYISHVLSNILPRNSHIFLNVFPVCLNILLRISHAFAIILQFFHIFQLFYKEFPL